CTDCTITELNQNPSIEVVKTAITTSFAKIGDIINYVITVKNTGNVTLNQVMVKDPLTGLNATIEVLATGETREFPQSYTVTQEDLNKGSVLNVASATGKDPKGGTVSDEDSEIVSEKETPIDAVNDTAGPIVGINQITTNVINVFTNDTLNGTAVNPNDVILSTDNSNPYLHLNEDGSVDVLANAPEGTLTLTYQICEKLNTTNCDTATVTITIVKPIMTVTAEAICINDVPYLKYTTTAVNFTPTNGVTLTWVDGTNKIVSTMENLPLNGQVLWPGATVDSNGVGTDWPGWLLVDNKWIQGADGFENIRPTASVTFALNPEVTVIVNYPPADPFCTSRPTFKIDAVDDTAGPINGFYGATNVLNVFTNDTLNTVAVNPSDVNLKEIANSSNGLLTLNADGTVDVKPNTPTGTYTLTYQICEKADANNCDTAVVTVTVVNTPPIIPIVAEDDLVLNVNGATGATNILNVLTNDFLDNKTPTLNTVTLTLVTPDPTGSLTLNPDGTINVKEGTPAGTYTFVYQICEIGKPTNCDTATVRVTVICNDFTKVYGKVNNVDTNTPLANVPITLKPLNGTPGPVLFRVTKADGSYSFDNMVAGEYVLQVQDANLNSAYELFNTTPSFLIITVEKCNYQIRDFGYGKTDLPVLGDFVWYDLNNNGKQDEWYDANNDNLVTQNIPDANGIIDYSKWEWIDFNGDGSYQGVQNTGELNAAGFGNGTTNVPNIYITGPNGFSRTVTMGILGYWRTRPAAGAYGEYRIEIKEEPLLEAASQAIAATGLVKVLPSTSSKEINPKVYKSTSYIDCGTTTNNVLFATLTAQKPINLDIDFGISCKTFAGLDAIDDSYSFVQCSQTGVIGNVITANDLLNGTIATTNDVNFKILTGSNPFITFDGIGNVTILSGISVGKYTFTYQICNTQFPTDCDTATVTIEVTPIAGITINSTACNADTSVIDLNTLLPTTVPTGGTWIDSSNSSALNGSIFSPFELALGNYQFEYKITNGDCPQSVVIDMNVNFDCKVLGCGTVIVHNAFTPNGDGLNEIFKIDNIDDTICYPENSIEIYNRWGVLVFETKNYNNTSNYFDGVSRGRTTISQSSGLPTGTYFYILNYTSFDLNGNPVQNKKDGYLYLSK
ncbi:gliding motility-associated C-terminal domain-containing protein, partial [Flavobacterium sp. RSSB_23]|uniref:T9SS type B sorting domain-containing protein n=1 Tax=Flavobacterium sp. RSSB_23 TaxID=3447668 RepID=UPI003F37E6A0